MCELKGMTYLCLKVTLALINTLPLQRKSCVQLTSPCFVVCLSNTVYQKTGNSAALVFVTICAGAALACGLIWILFL